MIKHCGRIICKCREELYALTLKKQIYSTNKLEIKKIIEKRKKELRGCYGSYQVMKKNLEKISP